MDPLHATVATGPGPGAIALIVLRGPVAGQLPTILNTPPPEVGGSKLVSITGIDEALLVRVSEDVAFLMPHAGPRIVQRITQHLDDHGVILESRPDPSTLFPEATTEMEARVLGAIASAPSPLAIDLLLAQPMLWNSADAADDVCPARDIRLNHLLNPPTVALIGPANVGKSTLTNALAGRSRAIALDQPGTTRDAVSCQIDLAGLVVRWIDMPGYRRTTDLLEHEAIDRSIAMLDDAHLIISATDHEQPWVEDPPRVDLRVALKRDRGRRDDGDLSITAINGEGIDLLVGTIRERLVPDADLRDPRPWRFWTAHDESDPRMPNGGHGVQ